MQPWVQAASRELGPELAVKEPRPRSARGISARTGPSAWAARTPAKGRAGASGQLHPLGSAQPYPWFHWGRFQEPVKTLSPSPALRRDAQPWGEGRVASGSGWEWCHRLATGTLQGRPQPRPPASLRRPPRPLRPPRTQNKGASPRQPPCSVCPWAGAYRTLWVGTAPQGPRLGLSGNLGAQSQGLPCPECRSQLSNPWPPHLKAPLSPRAAPPPTLSWPSCLPLSPGLAEGPPALVEGSQESPGQSTCLFCPGAPNSTSRGPESRVPGTRLRHPARPPWMKPQPPTHSCLHSPLWVSSAGATCPCPCLPIFTRPPPPAQAQ